MQAPPSPPSRKRRNWPAPCNGSAGMRRGAGANRCLRNVLEMRACAKRFDFLEDTGLDGRPRTGSPPRRPGADAGGKRYFAVDAKCPLGRLPRLQDGDRGADARGGAEGARRIGAQATFVSPVQQSLLGPVQRRAHSRRISWPCSCPATASPAPGARADADERGDGPAGADRDPHHPVRPVQGGRLRLARRGSGGKRRPGRRARQGSLQAPVAMGGHVVRMGKALEKGRSAPTTPSSARWKPRC